MNAKITTALSIAFSACVMVSGCKKKSSDSGSPAPAAGSSAPTAEAPAAPAAPAAPPAAAPSDVNADSVELQFTGKYEKGDSPGDEFPTFKVTNKSTHKLFFIKGWHYFYDKDKKQLGREYAERSVGSIDPGQSKELAFGQPKAKQPPGTETVEAVFVGGNFSDSVEFKGKVSDLAPEQRPMKGG
jgi:hypothetical protein